VTRTSDAVHTKSISNAANNRTVSWAIDSKLNANWEVGCFSIRAAGGDPAVGTNAESS
jgi:hypothetical protein